MGTVVLLLVTALVLQGAGISARRTPWLFEAAAARAAWRFFVPSAVRRAVNLSPDTREVLDSALEHYADHCAVCHANDGSGDVPIGRNVFPPAPDLRVDRTQRLTDGELYYAIEQGIPWTAMPAWGNGTPEGQRQSWELVRFIRHLPRLTDEEEERMEHFNPRSPASEARDRRIEEFLQGSPAPSKNVR